MISIIIPSFQNLNNLKNCILSIENQTYKNYEVWIVDGNSNDGTKSYLKSLKLPFKWISQPDNGIYDAMNKGISLSKGNWLLFLGADDKLYSNEILSNIFNEPVDKSTELIIGKIKFDWKKTDSSFLKRNDGIITPAWSKKIWIKNTLPHQGVFYNMCVFQDARYSFDYDILADYAFNLCLYKKNTNVKVVDAIISICGANGVSKNYNWSQYQEEIKLKTTESSILFKPFFIVNSGIKYLIKKLKY